MLTSDYKIFMEPGTAQMDSFQYSDIPLWKKAWVERIEPNVEYYSKFLGECFKAMYCLVIY